MARNAIYVQVEVEPIVKLKCLAVDCENNLMFCGDDRSKAIYCNLKHIDLDEQARCRMYKRGEK